MLGQTIVSSQGPRKLSVAWHGQTLEGTTVYACQVEAEHSIEASHITGTGIP